MHKEKAGRQNADSRLFSLDIFRHKSQHYPNGLVIWGASFFFYFQLEILQGLAFKNNCTLLAASGVMDALRSQSQSGLQDGLHLQNQTESLSAHAP